LFEDEDMKGVGYAEYMKQVNIKVLFGFIFLISLLWSCSWLVVYFLLAPLVSWLVQVWVI
jgi:hypothetical protein